MSEEHVENSPAAGVNAANPAPTDTHQESAPIVTESENVGQQAGDTSMQEAATPAVEDNSGQPERESRAKERIQELVRRAKEAEGRAETAEKQLQQYQSEPLKEPHEYESDSDYQRALIREELRHAERERLQREQKAAAENAQHERINAYEARANEARAKIPDFDQVAHSQHVPYSNAMIQLVQESDLGPEIAYHLGKNPYEADRIASLSPLSAAREIGRLESKFAQTARPKVSNAPPPVKTISGTGAIEQKKLEDMNLDEFYRARGFDPSK